MLSKKSGSRENIIVEHKCEGVLHIDPSQSLSESANYAVGGTIIWAVIGRNRDECLSIETSI